MSDDWRADVARAIADRAAVDWDALDVPGRASTDPALVDELRILEHVARVHTLSPADSAERVASPSLDVLPAEWGPLTVLEHIGRGTFGDVYRAHDRRLDRMVALKILRRQQPAAATAVIAEACLLARVSHPNVVTVYGAERIGGQVGVWMSLIDGPTLEDELGTRGPFDPLTVAGIGLDLCSALDAVHRAGVVHHDVKAQNVMRAADGRIVLADFGAGSDAAELGTATAVDLAGTPLYLAPEVLAKHPASPQSDIYSLGVVLFHLLTGSFPLVGHTIDDLRQAHAAGLRRRVRDLRPDVPPRLSRIVDRCLAPNPADRFQEIGGVAQALRGASGRAWTARRALMTATVVLTVVGVLFALWRDGRSQLVLPAGPASTSADVLSLRRILDRGSTSVSEDGRYLVFGPFVQDLASGVRRRWQPEAETGSLGLGSAISRDGTQVAYEWCTVFQKCELRVRPLNSANTADSRRLSSAPDPDVRLRPADWSPDGQWVLVEKSHTDGAGEIGVLSVHDGSWRVLTSIDWRGSTTFFSPDGRAFAFDVPASDTESQRDIFVMASDGSGRVRVVGGPANDVLMGWSPDGHSLLFASNRSGTTDLWAVPVSDRRAPGTPGRLKADIGKVRSVGMTKTGSLYLRTPANEVDIEVVSIDLRSGRAVGAAARPPQSVAGTNLEPAWSPDGTRLAYVSRRDGDGLAGTIAIYSVSTRDLRELPPLKLVRAQGLSWAPDGRSLAFTAVDLKGRFGLFRVDVNIGDVSPIAHPISLTFEGPFWSPDGKRLYFHPIDGAIHEWDTTLGSQRTIIPAPTADAWRNLGPISVSPDGRWIASYARPADLLQSVVIRPVDGGESREILRLSDGEFDVMPMPWAPTSDAVIVRKFATLRNVPSRGGELWLIPLNGRAPRKLDVDLSAAVEGQLGKIRLSPNGKQLAYVVGRSYQTETWVLENFLPTGTGAQK
ncbi:MAG: protein kinase [Vicinamibacterales bacterium]